MLFFVGVTRHSDRRRERRIRMQLNLFDNRPRNPNAPPIWEHLGPDERTRVIVVLVRAMREMVRPEKRRVNDER
jgi:hypothetical protein